MLIGEAWGQKEAETGQPFSGLVGGVLKGMLSQVGIPFKDCYVTNVFNLQPRPTNSVVNLCGPKVEGILGLPYLLKGKYVNAKYTNELERLYDEIINHNPNLIVALGATAAWSLLGTSGIKSIRGAPALAHVRDKPFKVLPTYHPSAVARDYKLRPIVLADLDKAKREAAFADVRRPKREIWIEPTLEDMYRFKALYIDTSDELSPDIETYGDQITCIGFAPTVDRALVVPFYDPSQPDGNYWRTHWDELKAWKFVRKVCSAKRRVLVGQNFMYDMHFLWRSYGITSPHHTDDTMLLHHALQPEMEKSLGFLGSVYTNEASWKFMRTKHTVKQGDS